MRRSTRDDTQVVRVEAVRPSGTRLPPFGREVAGAVAAGNCPNLYVYAGPNAWDRARARRASHGAGSALLLPVDDDPAAFLWPTISNGLLVVAVGQPHSIAFALTLAIVSCGTPLACALYGDNDMLIVRSREWAIGSELAA